MNPRPENDKLQYQQPNGNASYSNADGKISLLSDSIKSETSVVLFEHIFPGLLQMILLISVHIF